MTQPANNQPPALEWKEVHNITVNDVVCTIKQSTHKRPRYSFAINFFGTRGQPCRWHNVQWEGDGNNIKVKDTAADASQAVQEAEAWVTARMKQDYWDARAESDEARANWEKQRPRNVGTHQKGKASA